MKETESEDTFLREIMSKSKLVLNLPEFDNSVMELIEMRHSKKASISRDIKLSWIFFILGAAFGIIVSIILPKIQKSVFGISLDNLSIPFLIIFSFMLMTQLDSLIFFYKSQKKINKRLPGRFN